VANCLRCGQAMISPDCSRRSESYELRFSGLSRKMKEPTEDMMLDSLNKLLSPESSFSYSENEPFAAQLSLEREFLRDKLFVNRLGLPT